MNNNDQRPHLWIPDSEIQKSPKTKTMPHPEPKNIIHTEHGAKLGSNIQTVMQTLKNTEEDNSLKNSDIQVFKVSLLPSEKVRSNVKIFSSNGMRINVIKNEHCAVVSTSKQQFQKLKNKVDEYAKSGKCRYFENIDNISPYIGTEKNSSVLQKRLRSKESSKDLDIQLMLIPNLQTDEYETILKTLNEKIKRTGGTLQETYSLSDNTPVVRAVIPSAALERYENDSAIYRIEETHFFNAVVNDNVAKSPLHMALNSDVDLLLIELKEMSMLVRI